MTFVSRPVTTLVPDTPLVNNIDPISLMVFPLASSGSPTDVRVIAEKQDYANIRSKLVGFGNFKYVQGPPVSTSRFYANPKISYGFDLIGFNNYHSSLNEMLSRSNGKSLPSLLKSKARCYGYLFLGI